MGALFRFPALQKVHIQLQVGYRRAQFVRHVRDELGFEPIQFQQLFVRSAQFGSALGNVLLVTRAEVLRTFALFTAIALVHVVLRRRFMLVTFHEQEAQSRGVSLRLWDFLFYATFGLTVTSFVQISGVYLVFSYLIVPAVCGALVSGDVRTRLAVGWAVALMAGVSGLLLSIKIESLDLAMIVFDIEDTFGIEIPYNANEEAADFKTVGSVVDRVKSLMSGAGEGAAAGA